LHLVSQQRQPLRRMCITRPGHRCIIPIVIIMDMLITAITIMDIIAIMATTIIITHLCIIEGRKAESVKLKAFGLGSQKIKPPENFRRLLISRRI
jgi:hypothetical protein